MSGSKCNSMCDVLMDQCALTLSDCSQLLLDAANSETDSLVGCLKRREFPAQALILLGLSAELYRRSLKVCPKFKKSFLLSELRPTAVQVRSNIQACADLFPPGLLALLEREIVKKIMHGRPISSWVPHLIYSVGTGVLERYSYELLEIFEPVPGTETSPGRKLEP